MLRDGLTVLSNGMVKQDNTLISRDLNGHAWRYVDGYGAVNGGMGFCIGNTIIKWLLLDSLVYTKFD